MIWQNNSWITLNSRRVTIWSSLKIFHSLKARADGEEVSSKIVTKSHDNGQMVLQGTQNQLGWSMAIMEKSGQMVLTASGDGVGYVVFGACTPIAFTIAVNRLHNCVGQSRSRGYWRK